MYIWIERNKEIDRLKRINTMSEDEFIKWQESKNPRSINKSEIKRSSFKRSSFKRSSSKRRSKTIFKPNLIPRTFTKV